MFPIHVLACIFQPFPIVFVFSCLQVLINICFTSSASIPATMSSNHHILALESDTKLFKEVHKPLKAILSTPLADVGGAFNALDLDDESPIHDAPLNDLCE